MLGAKSENEQLKSSRQKKFSEKNLREENTQATTDIFEWT